MVLTHRAALPAILIQIKSPNLAIGFHMLSGESGVSIVEDMMTTAKTVTIAAALLLGGASLAMAQNGPPTGGQLPVAGGAGGGWYGGWYPGYGYGYAAAPLYDYAAPAYGYAAPAYVVPAPVYTAPSIYVAPAVSGYYTAAPLYNYAPGYWGRAGYWWR